MRTLALLAFLALSAPAQTQNEPFFLIRIVRSGPPLESEANPASAYRDGNAAIDVLNMQAVSGPAQTWMLESHRSFGSIEAVDKVISRSQSGDATRWIGLFATGSATVPMKP